MAKSASYDVILDSKVSRKIGGDIDEEFPIQLQSGASVGSRSVLSFMVDAISPSNLQFRVSIINGNNVNTDVGTYTIGSNLGRVLQEVVDGNVLTASGNKLKVRVLSGGGTLEVADIVLMYLLD